MKLFSLEEALAGSPVCTRDGRTVTQLVKFDAVSPRPLIGVVDGTIFAWPANGVLDPGITHRDDLIMAPIIRKGWIARYGYPYCSKSYVAGVIFGSEEDVEEAEPDAISYHEISWEE
jgi:hypothetical protein